MSAPVSVNCMHGSAAVGGSARVGWLAEAAADTVGMDALAATLLQAAPAAGVTVFVNGAARQYRAESYQQDGRPIQFCGHGALAAALYVFCEHEQQASELCFSNRRHNWVARQAVSLDANALSGDSSERTITLSYTRPEVTACAVPAFAAAVMGIQPIKAAQAGGSEDYLLLEFDSPAAVRSLTPDFNSLASATRRAVVATAAAVPAGQSSLRKNPPGIVFRYFAPRYGQPEDDATGSAAVQLAAYWAPRLGEASFVARQLSAGGALMSLACKGDAVELSARVAYGA